MRPGDSKHCFVLFVAVSPIIIGMGGLLGHRIKFSCGCDDFLSGGWRSLGTVVFCVCTSLEALNIASFVLSLFHWFFFSDCGSDESSYGAFMLVR